jgi:nucleoside diphosphate kinase
MTNIQRTFAMIKPDAVSNGFTHLILQAINDSGIKISFQKKVRFTPESILYFYTEHTTKPFFPNLLECMTSSDSICLILEGENVIKVWREMIGPTNVKIAKATALNSLRALYGDTENTAKNVCHGSDSLESADKEIDFILNGPGSLL